LSNLCSSIYKTLEPAESQKSINTIVPQSSAMSNYEGNNTDIDPRHLDLSISQMSYKDKINEERRN